MRNGPDYMQFYPTIRCNRSCDFCFNREMPFVPDMPLSSFRLMLSTLDCIGVKTLDIIGGEPTMHPAITSCVCEAVRQGLSVNLSSNGSNLPLLAEMMQLGQKVNVGISVNDRAFLTQATEFIETRKPIVKSLYQHGHDDSLVGEILSLGPKKFFLIYRDALHRTELNETVPFHQFFSDVDKRFDPLLVGTVFCSGFLPDIDRYPELGQVRCPAGTTKLGIMPDGSVYPCNLFFGEKEFLLGNILMDPFPSIWNHEALAFFRSPRQNECPDKTCILHARCHGGCPAHSFAYAGRLDAPDPRCFPG